MALPVVEFGDRATYRALLARTDGPVAERLRAEVAVAGQVLDEDPPSPALPRARQSLPGADVRCGERARR